MIEIQHDAVVIKRSTDAQLLTSIVDSDVFFIQRLQTFFLFFLLRFYVL